MHSITRAALACLPALVLACGATGATNTTAPQAAVAPGARCTRTALEADIEYGMPLTGPGVDPATGKLVAPPPAGYVASTTYLALKSDAASNARFQELVGPVISDLQHQPGLRALQVSNSKECTTARTLTVWQDEAAMLAFVSGSAHAAASAGIAEISRGGSAVVHWHAMTLDQASWSYAAERLSTASAEF
jgi:heme-degrading monooxygenase HmoA